MGSSAHDTSMEEKDHHRFEKRIRQRKELLFSMLNHGSGSQVTQTLLAQPFGSIVVKIFMSSCDRGILR